MQISITNSLHLFKYVIHLFSMEQNEITIYTDGGCHGNPGVGAWACVIIEQNKLTELSGGDKLTTNNKMELSAAINALKAVHNLPNAKTRTINIFCDSQYVKNGITSWIQKWKQNGWRTSAKKPVLNQELWVELDRLVAGLNIKWKWVKGHAGVEYNERCDALCQKEMQKLEC